MMSLAACVASVDGASADGPTVVSTGDWSAGNGAGGSLETIVRDEEVFFRFGGKTSCTGLSPIKSGAALTEDGKVELGAELSLSIMGPTTKCGDAKASQNGDGSYTVVRAVDGNRFRINP